MSYSKGIREAEYQEIIAKKRAAISDGYKLDTSNYYEEKYVRDGNIIPIPYVISVGYWYYKVDYETYYSIYQLIQNGSGI